MCLAARPEILPVRALLPSNQEKKVWCVSVEVVKASEKEFRFGFGAKKLHFMHAPI